jgi:F-type H+-transporting ATPase subunit c
LCKYKKKQEEKFMELVTGEQFVKALALLAAGIAMGFGAVGPGIGEGFVAGKACEAIGKRPDEQALITKTMIIGQAISETTGIYALVVSLILIFVV